MFARAEAVRPESVITVTGEVVVREAGTVNPKLPTGEMELRVTDLAVQSAAEVLPMQVAGDEKFPEDTESRLKLGLYAASRASQMRRMRAPRPQVKHGASVD